MSFNITYNALLLNATTNYTVKDITGLFEIPVRTDSADLTGSNGGNIFAQAYGMRPISFSGQIYGTDSITFLNTLSAFINAFSKSDVSQSLQIEITAGLIKTLMARVVQEPTISVGVDEFGINVAQYQVFLLVEDVLFSDNTSTTYSTGLAQTGGTPIPGQVPMPLGGGGGGSVVVVNSGVSGTDAIFKIQGASLNPVIRNATSGSQFQITNQILAGEIITIQRSNSGISVISNLNGNYYQYLSGDIFTFLAGNNTITFSASGYDPSALLTLIFANRTKSPI